jgi:hypothetical protein
MKKRRTLKDRILLRISLKKDKVFMRDDFHSFGGYDQVGRALKELVQEGKLLRIGYGLYTKTKISSITGELVPVAPLSSLAREALSKLHVPVRLSISHKRYNTGLSTQIPTGRMIAVRGRIIRKIGYNGIYINYERQTQ